MKLLSIVLCVLLFTSCKKTSKTKQLPSFLIGNWVRINQLDSINTYEKWDANFKGIGLTLKGKDTTFYEKMEIVTLNDSLFLKVTGVNQNPTLFKFTSQSDTSFIAENSKNEFPKKIYYYKENGLLKAIVSNPDFKIDFVFDQKTNFSNITFK